MTHREQERAIRRAAWARSLLTGIASLSCLIMCQAFIGGMPQGSTSVALTVLDAFGGLRLWAALFGFAGLAGLAVAAVGWRANWLVLLTGALFGMWGFVYLTSWIVADQPRGYVTASWLLLVDVLLSALLLLPSRRPCPLSRP